MCYEMSPNIRLGKCDKLCGCKGLDLIVQFNYFRIWVPTIKNVIYEDKYRLNFKLFSKLFYSIQNTEKQIIRHIDH